MFSSLGRFSSRFPSFKAKVTGRIPSGTHAQCLQPVCAVLRPCTWLVRRSLVAALRDRQGYCTNAQPRKGRVLKVGTRRSVISAGVVAALLVLALVAGLDLRNDNTVAPPSTPTPTASSTPPLIAGSASPIATASPSGGAITGRFGYPSDFIPPLTVYAISLDDPKVFFSVDFAGFGNPPRPTLPPGVSQPTYTLTSIAPGTYYVLAYRNDGNPGLGVYTQYTVQCQQATQGGQFSTPAPGCAANDRSLLPVTVRAGETTSRIDITDWVFQQNGYPIRPR